MGRRSRRRAETPAHDDARPAGQSPRRRQRRREFRTAIGDTPISTILGQMVGAEVGRHRARRVREDDVTDAELIAAAERARVLRDELVALVERLEQRIDHG